jgi:AmmeMemoRadiSam system protein B
MPTQERPQLRPYLVPGHDPSDPAHVYLVDQLGLLPDPVELPRHALPLLELLDGTRTLRDLQADVMRLSGGELVPLENLARLVQRLDEVGLLDGPGFRAVADGPVREPRCIGCYEGEPAALRRQLRRLFLEPGGPGLPRAGTPDGTLRAALIPHIDYPRGGHTYAWGFKEVFERTDASLFVIIGTSHYGAHPRTLGRKLASPPRFTLTRKGFKTPLGVAPTDQEFIDRLVRHYGDGLFDDELIHHLPEHSIELEVVFLQYLYEKVRPIRIVPLVVGSFHDCVFTGDDPSAREDVRRMVEALRRAEAETRERVCYIISGDLAHIGRKFDRHAPPLTEPVLTHSRSQDQAILRELGEPDLSGFFRTIADEGDRRNICGLPPAWTTLAAVQPARGKLLHYDQYVHPRGYESVSFASVAFYR